jgi:hypothetical protein
MYTTIWIKQNLCIMGALGEQQALMEATKASVKPQECATKSYNERGLWRWNKTKRFGVHSRLISSVLVVVMGVLRPDQQCNHSQKHATYNAAAAPRRFAFPCHHQDESVRPFFFTGASPAAATELRFSTPFNRRCSPKIFSSTFQIMHHSKRWCHIWLLFGHQGRRLGTQTACPPQWDAWYWPGYEKISLKTISRTRFRH